MVLYEWPWPDINLTHCGRLARFLVFVFQASRTDHYICCFWHVSFVHTLYCSHKSRRSTDWAAVLSDIYSSFGYPDITLRTHLSLKKDPLFSFTAKLFFQSVNSWFSIWPCRKHSYITERKHFSWKMWFFQNYYLTIYRCSWGYFSDKWEWQGRFCERKKNCEHKTKLQWKSSKLREKWW
jgi:hypothetical protein